MKGARAYADKQSDSYLRLLSLLFVYVQIVFFSPDSITFVYNNAVCSPPPPPPPHFIYNRGQ